MSITRERKILFISIPICLSILWFSTSVILYKFEVIPSVSIYPMILALVAFLLDLIMPDSEKIKDTIFLDLWSKWHLRYSYALLYSISAFVLFDAWQSGSVHGKTLLLVNPFVAALLILVALFKAKELTILLVIISIAYWLVIGLISLPLSLAIIIAACIIAFAISATKKA